MGFLTSLAARATRPRRPFPCRVEGAGALACFLVLAALPGFAAPADRAADLVLRGRIDGGDHQTYREVPFDVPEDVARITVVFEYTGRDERTTIDIGLLGPDGFTGPEGFRGWSGSNKHEFTVAAADATPSYLPGRLAPGRWNLLLGIPNIRAGRHAEFTARVFFERRASPEGPAFSGSVLNEEARWYRGDLHLHSGHSDGRCRGRGGARVPCPLFLTLESAAGRGLDFVALTEHNTISHLAELRALQPYFGTLLLIPGMEVTTFEGHANVFGVAEPVDFRVGSAAVPDWNVLLRRLQARDLTISINHPGLPSDERCMGCGWRPEPAADLGRVHAVEVVNGADADTPVSGIAFWHEQLNAGHRLTGIGGSDNHDATLETGSFGAGRVGAPATVVFARSLSMGAIHEALRAGRVFVDVQGSPDRLLEMTAAVEGRAVSMGAEIDAPARTPVTLEVRVHNVRAGRIELIRDGRIVATLGDAVITGADHRARATEISDGLRHWWRADVRDVEGRLLLVGNPIYANRRSAGTESGK